MPIRNKEGIRVDSGGIKVLVVEDNSMNMQLVTDILTLNGYETIGASSGAEALKLVAMENPDIVLMDLHLPGMDGMTATRMLKADVRYRDIPVLALTAAAGSVETDTVLSKGFDGCVTKPIKKELLLEVISSFTEKKDKPDNP